MRKARSAVDVALGKFTVFVSRLGGMHVERNHLLGRKAHSEWALRAVNARIDLGIKLELDSKFLFRKALHGKDFVLVDGGGDRLELQRQAPRAQQFDAVQAAFVRTRNPGESFIRRLGTAVKGDLDRKRRPLQKMVGNALVDQNSIGKKGD